MRRIVLASVKFETPLSQGLDCIHPKTRAVVVDRREEGPLLLTASDIMEATNNARDAHLDPAKIELGRVTARLWPINAKPRPLPSDFDMPHDFKADRNFDVTQVFDLTPQERTHYEAVFADDIDPRYAIQQIAGDVAVVVTASERLAYDLGTSFTICTCAGDPVHRFEPRQLRVPGRCNKPHAKPVICRPASGP